jgi:anaerobic selenocysteine-containing dehydrogenase
MDTRTGHAFCMLCEAICGVAVEHDGERVLSVRGDPEHPLSRGHICPKGVALADVQNDPDRLRRPLRRRGERWEEVGWDEALDEAAMRIAEVQQRDGNDAVGLYVGNPTNASHSAFLFLDLLATSLDTRNRFTANSVDALPRLLTSSLLYGRQTSLPVPDIDRSSFLLVLGANPLVSNGSVMTVPDVGRRLRELRERGGRWVVVDPRRTESASVADEHHFIRPGTDALFLAAMLHTLFAEQRIAPRHLVEMLDGLDQLPELLSPFTPEAVAQAVGVEAATIARLARDFASAPSAACYGRMGTSTQEFGTLATWLIDLLNILTGNLDRPGGAMFTTPAVDLGPLSSLLGQVGEFERWRSRVSGLPEFNGELPVAALAEEIETPGRGRIRALITHAGNPVLSLPNGPRLSRAFEGLDFMLSIDIYRNETSRHAHLILPPAFGLEQDAYPLVYQAMAVRNTAQYAPALLERPAGSLRDWEVVLELGRRIGARRGGLARWQAGLQTALARWIGPSGALRLLLRLGPQPVSLGRLRREPHGVDLGPLEPRLPGLLGRGRRIRLVPEPMRRDLPRLERRLANASAAEAGLLLIGRRTLRSNNSWMHNCERLVSGRERCVLLMHPDDARQRGLATGQRAVLKSRAGRIEVSLDVSDEVMPGVVSLPHGWGHDRPGTQLRVAALHPGVSMNDAVDDACVDALSGTSILNGLPVSVEAIRRQPAEEDRSGTGEPT